MLGHELRNPLSPIATALQLMKLRSDSRTSREQQVIERQVNHLTRLVDDLLDVSKITRGKVELRKERVEIADVIAKAVEMASDLFEQRSHDLSVDVAKERLWVDGDPVRLAQVVANLLTNAARYTERGGRITVSARREGERAGHMTLRKARSSSGSRTTARASRPTCSPGSSISSSRGTAAPIGRRAVSVSAWRWSRTWSRFTAAASWP